MGILTWIFGLSPKYQPGVYSITNRRTGRFYIGATTLAMTERWLRHRSMLRAGRHHNKRLQADWDRYGTQAFKFAVIEVVQGADRVFEREQYWQRLRHNDKCYNPHPDDRTIPDYVRKRAESRARRQLIDHSAPEIQEAIQRIYDLVPGAKDELSAWFQRIGYPSEDVPPPEEMREAFRIFRAAGVKREVLRSLWRVIGLPLDNNLWARVPPPPEPEYTTPIAGRVTAAQFDADPDLAYQPPPR